MAKMKEHTQEEITAIKEDLYTGTGFSGGKERVYKEYMLETNTKKRIDFLKKEYGIGGRTLRVGEFTGVNYDAKGMTLTYSFDSNKPGILFSWNEVDKVLQEIIADKSRKYLTTLYNQNEGIFIFPVCRNISGLTDKIYTDIFEMNGLSDTEKKDYYLEYENISSLYPIVNNCVEKNRFTYNYERELYGKIQRIGLNNDNKLQIALIYCYDKEGNFNPDIYNKCVNNLSKVFKDTKLYIPTNLCQYDNTLKYYFGIPKEYTENIFNKQKDINNLYLFHDNWGIDKCNRIQLYEYDDFTEQREYDR